MSGSVSIIICTRNQADSLGQTLASLRACDVPADFTAELLVVDNGSSDHTQQVVEQAVFDGRPVRRVVEPTPGQARARNTGLRATGSDVIVFTDDDVRLPANWLAGMCRPILLGEADAMAGGVHFPPAYELPLSREPYRSRRGWLASTEGIDPLEPHLFVGANMAFSRRVVETLGGFDPELGPGALGFCDEVLFAFRLLEAGFRMKSSFDVSVEHHFDLSRLTRRALLDIAARMGRSSAYVDYHWDLLNNPSAPAQRRRAAMLLAVERIKAPWRALTGAVTLEETQRVQTLAYWRELTELAGQPRRYQRTTTTRP